MSSCICICIYTLLNQSHTHNFQIHTKFPAHPSQLLLQECPLGSYIPATMETFVQAHQLHADSAFPAQSYNQYNPIQRNLALALARLFTLDTSRPYPADREARPLFSWAAAVVIQDDWGSAEDVLELCSEEGSAGRDQLSIRRQVEELRKAYLARVTALR